MKTWRILHYGQTWLVLSVLAVAGISMYIMYVLKAPAEFPGERERIRALVAAKSDFPQIPLPAVAKPGTNEHERVSIKRAVAVTMAFNRRGGGVAPVRLHLSAAQRATIADYLAPVRERLRRDIYPGLFAAEQRLSLLCAPLLFQVEEAGSPESWQLLEDITSASKTFLARNADVEVDVYHGLLHVMQFQAEQAETSAILAQLLKQTQFIGADLTVPPAYLSPELDEEFVETSGLRGQVTEAAIRKASQLFVNAFESPPVDDMLVGIYNTAHWGDQPYQQSVPPNWTSLLAHRALFRRITTVSGVPALDELTGIEELGDVTLREQIAYFASTKPIKDAQKLYISSRAVATQRLIVERWIAEKLYHRETGQWATDAAVLSERYQLNHKVPPASIKELIPLTYPKLQATVNSPLGAPIVRSVASDAEIVLGLLGVDAPTSSSLHTRHFQVSLISTNTSGLKYLVHSSHGMGETANYPLSLASLAAEAPHQLNIQLGNPDFYTNDSRTADYKANIAAFLLNALRHAKEQDADFPVEAFIPEQLAVHLGEPSESSYAMLLEAEVSLPDQVEIITYDGPAIEDMPSLYLQASRYRSPRLIHPREYEEWLE